MPRINQPPTFVAFNQSRLLKEKDYHTCPLEWQIFLKNSHIQVRF